MFDEKTQSRAVGSAAKAVIELLGGAYRKRRAFLGVKGAKPRVIGTRAFELNVLTHHFNDINAPEQIINKLLGNHGLSLRPVVMVER